MKTSLGKKHLITIAMATILTVTGTVNNASAATLSVSGERCVLDVTNQDFRDIDSRGKGILEEVRSFLTSEVPEKREAINGWLGQLEIGREDKTLQHEIGTVLTEEMGVSEGDLGSFAAMYIDLISSSKKLLVDYGSESGATREHAKELLETDQGEADLLASLATYQLGDELYGVVAPAVLQYMKDRERFYVDVLQLCAQGKSGAVVLAGDNGSSMGSSGKGSEDSSPTGVVGLVVAVSLVVLAVVGIPGLRENIERLVTRITFQ